MYFSKQSLDISQALMEAAMRKRLTIASAESCTGGLIAACLTEISGASLVFTRGFITYANDAKIDLLGVSEELIDSVGAVSEEVARELIERVRRGASPEDLSDPIMVKARVSRLIEGEIVEHGAIRVTQGKRLGTCKAAIGGRAALITRWVVAWVCFS